jgi:hypothetical protein
MYKLTITKKVKKAEYENQMFDYNQDDWANGHVEPRRKIVEETSLEMEMTEAEFELIREFILGFSNNGSLTEG